MTTTAKLAASIRADEERMLEFVVRRVPKLARAVVRSEIDGDAVLRHHQDRSGRRGP